MTSPSTALRRGDARGDMFEAMNTCELHTSAKRLATWKLSVRAVVGGHN